MKTNLITCWSAVEGCRKFFKTESESKNYAFSIGKRFIVQYSFNFDGEIETYHQYCDTGAEVYALVKKCELNGYINIKIIDVLK